MKLCLTFSLLLPWTSNPFDLAMTPCVFMHWALRAITEHLFLEKRFVCIDWILFHTTVFPLCADTVVYHSAWCVVPLLKQVSFEAWLEMLWFYIHECIILFLVFVLVMVLGCSSRAFTMYVETAHIQQTSQACFSSLVCAGLVSVKWLLPNSPFGITSESSWHLAEFGHQTLFLVSYSLRRVLLM